MTKSPALLSVLSIVFASLVLAETPVDKSRPLETVDEKFQLADGPAWDGSWALYVPDVKGQKLFRYVPKTGKRQVVLKDAGRISATYYNLGQLYLSDNGNGQIAKLVNGKKVPLTPANPKERPNDLVVDKHGGVYFTLTRQNQVKYVSPDGNLKTVVESIASPNGIVLSPDGKTLYVSSFGPNKIWSYTIASDGLSAGQLFASMNVEGKGADGMTVDRAGNVYCAGPENVWIWDRSGKLLDKIKTPTRPINCAFAASDMQTLYITGFGGLYRQAMKISGRAPHPPATTETQPTRKNRPSTAIPDGVQADLDVTYAVAGDRPLLMDVFKPKSDNGSLLPAVVVVHGGGWLKGDKTKFRALAIALAKRGYLTAAIEYRLGGEAHFPAGIQDCNAAVRYLRANAKKLHIDPQRIGAVGGSAGGHLVGLMAAAPHVAALQGNSGHPDASSALQAAIVMAGPMEMASGSVAERSRKVPDKSNSNRWLGKTIDEAPDLYRLADAHLHFSKSAPPILFMTGEHDHPSRNQPTRDKLKKLGVWTDVKIYPDGKHGCWNQLPWFQTMVDDMDKFLRERLN